MVKVSHIRKKYGRREILKDVGFEGEKGQIISLVGRNGCGKTTLLKILSGVLSPDGGYIDYFGKDPLADRKIFRRYCGYVSQEDPLLPELSVRDNLKLWSVDRSENYEYILDRFELKDIMKRDVGKLSGGMKKRLSIACAVAFRPPVLILDEPSTSLDLYYKEEIRNYLSEYAKAGGIVLLSTHDEEDIRFCGRCLFMKDGTVAELTGADLQERIRGLFISTGE